MRPDNRSPLEHRPLTFQRNFTKHALGSVLVSYGETKVLCTVCVEEKVPPFLRDCGQGWLSAEYSLLPGATHTRASREVNKGKPSGRTQEIQRLIGRALRSVIDFEKLGERTLQIDADVLQADGGTRTAAITGSMVAVLDAVAALQKRGLLQESPIKECLGAISVGVVDGEVRCDLSYEEDSSADVDMNLVMTESGRFVEIQGTAESDPFSQAQLQDMLQAGQSAISSIIRTYKDLLEL